MKGHAPTAAQQPVPLRLAESEARALEAGKGSGGHGAAQTAVDMDREVWGTCRNRETSAGGSGPGKPVGDRGDPGRGRTVGVIGGGEGVEETGKLERCDPGWRRIRGDPRVRMDSDNIKSSPADRKAEMVPPAGHEEDFIADSAEARGNSRHKPPLVVPKQPEGILEAGDERQGGDDKFDRLPEEARAGVSLSKGRASRGPGLARRASAVEVEANGREGPETDVSEKVDRVVVSANERARHFPPLRGKHMHRRNGTEEGNDEGHHIHASEIRPEMEGPAGGGGRPGAEEERDTPRRDRGWLRP